jgi:hypothetical protein
MNVIYVPFLNALNNTDAKTASRILDNETEWHFIKSINWPGQYPYCPESEFVIARSHNSLYIKFKVNENNLRALYINDQDPVWEDSCVEFFCKKPLSESYMNFEFNCIGTSVASTRKGRDKDIVFFTENQMKQIDRFTTLNRKTFDEIKGPNCWELTVCIPFQILGIDLYDLPQKISGNFYKCADGSSTPHYVSWNPIATEQPDFHRPDFFGELILKKTSL